jgi:metal-dependent amidase/aminoacylase/carboxypeptidase family protein
MISDVLFEAVEEIERYQRDIPWCYDDPAITAEIEAVKASMTALRIKLDTPPPPPTADDFIKVSQTNPSITQEMWDAMLQQFENC